MNIQYIKEDGKPTFAVLPIADFESLVSAAERADDLRDIQATRDEESFPHDFVERLLHSDRPLAVWRDYRGMTQQELARSSGISQGYITQIESGIKTGSIHTLKALAHALDCDVDNLVKS